MSATERQDSRSEKIHESIQQELASHMKEQSTSPSRAASVSSGNSGGYVISEADYYLIEHVLIRLAAGDHDSQLARALRMVLQNAKPLQP